MTQRSLAAPQVPAGLLDSLPVGVLHAVNERIVYCNRRIAEIFGEPTEAILGRNFADLVAPEYREQVMVRYLLRQQGGKVPDTWELEIVRGDGALTRVEIEPRAVGPREHLILIREVNHTLRDIELANRLTALALHLQRKRSVRTVLDATERGLEELGLQFLAMSLDGEELVLHGTDVESLRVGLRVFEPIERVVSEGRALYLDELPPPRVPIDPRVMVVVRKHAHLKGVVAPLYVGASLWGVITVSSDSLSPRDAATIGLFASQVASAMENALVIDALDRTNRGLRAIHEVARAGARHELSGVLPRLLEVAASSTGSDSSAIFLADGESGGLSIAGSHGVECDTDFHLGDTGENGPIAQAVREKRPVVLRDLAIASIRHAVLLPLHVRGRFCGLLALGRTTDRAYGDEEVAQALPLAAQLAIQVENARLYSETRNQLDHLSVLFGLGRTIAGALEEAPLVEGALALLTERLPIDAGWIYVRRDERLVLVGCRAKGAEGALRAASALPMDPSTVCGEAAAARQPRVVELAEGDPRSPTAATLGMRHLAAFPLVVDDRLVGALSVARRDGRGFREEELQLFESCAVQLAVALERAQLFDVERRRVHDLSRINELGSLIAQQLELPALLSIGVEHMVRMVGVQQVFLLLLEPETQVLRVVASNLREPGILDIEIPVDAPSAASLAVRELRPVLIEDALYDPRAARTLALRFGQRAILAVPLIYRGEAIGVVSLAETEEGRTFSPAAFDRAVAMANQLAAAVANARLFEEERHRVHELSLLSELGRIASGTLQREVLLSECLSHIRGALGFDAGTAWFKHRSRLERAAAQGGCGDRPAEQLLDDSLARRAIESGVAICERLEGEIWACALPLLAGAEAGGVLAFARIGKPVTGAELRTLAAAAPELGVALQNARLFDEARRRVEELRLLLDIGRAITGSLDLDQILETSAGALSRFIDGSNAFILLLDPATREIRGAACSNPAWREEVRAMRIGLHEDTIVAHAVRRREPIVVPDVSRSEYRNTARVVRFREQSVLAVPLLVRDEPIGCILVDDTRSVRDWSPEELERATLIAHQVAVAVANARLYDDLKRSYGELARAQEELVKRERLAALGELSAVVAHEVRNPLGVIFNSLGSLRKLLKPTGDGAMLLDIVEEEADRLDRIVRDLLDFARPWEPALEAESLADVLDDTLKAAQGDRIPPHTSVEVDVPADLPLLRIDARMMRQVMLNLVLNGLQAMPRGGTLHIRAAFEPEVKMVRVEFADEGTGVPPELASRIFQPFFTTKASGTGLGLAVSKRFVEAHHGTITFQSRQGEGTTFVLRLPVDGGS